MLFPFCASKATGFDPAVISSKKLTASTTCALPFDEFRWIDQSSPPPPAVVYTRRDARASDTGLEPTEALCFTDSFGW